jgi:O-antigen/teichoic acid export membrane protein
MALLSFAAALMTTRMLGPVGYGTIAIVAIVSNLVFTASTSWTGVSVRRYGREHLELRGTMSTITWNRVLIGAPLVGFAMFAVLMLKVFHALPTVLSWELVGLALATALATVVVDHWSCLLETSGKMKMSAGAQILAQATYVAALGTVFLVGWHISPALVVTVSLATSVLLVVGVAPAIWKTGIVPIAVDGALLRRMLRLSTPLIALVFSQYVLASIDIVILRMFRGQADVGVYAVAYQAFGMLAAPATSATSVFLPLFVSIQIAGRKELIVRYLERAVPQLLFVMAVLAGFAAPLLPLLMPAVFGHDFARSAEPLDILLIGVEALSAAYVIAPILTLHEQTRATATINAIAAVINVAGDFFMIGVLGMGIIAPAIATSAALVFMFAAFYSRARNILERSVKPDVVAAAPLIAGLVPALAMGGLAGAVIGVSAVATLSGAILMWRSPFSQEDRDVLDKLQMPNLVKRAVFRVISLSRAT